MKATQPSPSANGTSPQWNNAAPPDPSTNGPYNAASTATTDSPKAKPTNSAPPSPTTTTTSDNHHIEPPGRAEDGYHVSEDLVDQAIGFVHDTKSVRPDKPFFLYVAFGATHAPHQAPAEYLDKYRGRYDEGWDVVRARWFANQLAMGVVPSGTALAPRNPGAEAWDDLPSNQQALGCRLQEAFAALLDHTDAQIGRLVDDLASLGELDNTIIMVLGDNGASHFLTVSTPRRHSPGNTVIELPPLPYPQDALAPHISERTIGFTRSGTTPSTGNP